MRHTSRFRQGFTLVEMVVVVPLIISLIGGLMAVTIYATTSALRVHARAQLQYDVLLALETIERDARLSVGISTAHTNRLTMENFATDGSAYSSGRSLVRRSDCAVEGGVYVVSPGEATTYSNHYWVHEGGLYRRADFTNRWCGGSQAAHSSGVRPRHHQSEQLIGNTVSASLSASYDPIPGRTGVAQSMTLTLSATRRIAGQDVTYSGTVYVEPTNQPIAYPAIPTQPTTP